MDNLGKQIIPGLQSKFHHILKYHNKAGGYPRVAAGVQLRIIHGKDKSNTIPSVSKPVKSSNNLSKNESDSGGKKR